MQRIFPSKAQSTVEYLILFAVVITVIIVAAQGKLRQAVKSMMDNVSDTIIESTDKIKESF